MLIHINYFQRQLIWYNRFLHIQTKVHEDSMIWNYPPHHWVFEASRWHSLIFKSTQMHLINSSFVEDLWPFKINVYHWGKFSVLCQWITKRLENDSTLGRSRSYKANTGAAWPFQIVICFMVHCIIQPNFRPWCDFLTFPNMSHHPSGLVQAYYGKFHVLWNAQKLAKHGHFTLKPASCTMHHPTKFQPR